MSSTKTREIVCGMWRYSGCSIIKNYYYYYSRDFGPFDIVILTTPVYKDEQKGILYDVYWGDQNGRFISSSEPAVKSG